MITVSGLSKRFGDTVAVDNVDFTARTGALTYLLGPNGAGKSTVMRMIVGLITPDSGSIMLNGSQLRGLGEVKHEIGVSLSPFARNPQHTALGHLRWQARLAGIPTDDARRVLHLVGLDGVATKRVGGFSFGMLQRLSIASALLGDPKTIVLDEPSNGLDVEGGLWLRALLTNLVQSGKCLLVASHSLSEVEITASHIIIMGRGRVLADGSCRTIVEMGSGPRPLESAYLEITRHSVDYAGIDGIR